LIEKVCAKINKTPEQTLPKIMKKIYDFERFKNNEEHK